MIIRVFRGRVKRGESEKFERFLKDRAVPFMSSQPGNLAQYVGRPVGGNADEFVYVSVWENVAALKQFAGEKWEKVVIHPDEKALLSELSMHHYESFHITPPLRCVSSLATGDVAIKEVTIHADSSKVFAALTKPSKLNTWFTTRARLDLRVGGRYANGDRDEGKFLEIVRNKRLRFTWNNPDHAPGTVVEIILTRNRGSTIVSLFHYGFTRRSDFEHYSSLVSGWDWALNNLKAYLEGKRVVQYEEWLDMEPNLDSTRS